MDIRDANFLRKLDENRNKSYYARISVLDMNENPIQSIEGRVLSGSSISIAGNSSVRRTCTINIIADKEENDLTDINNLLSINKKIKIFVGIDTKVDYSSDIVYVDGELSEIGDLGKIYIKRSDLSCQYWSGVEYITIKDIYDYQNKIVWFPIGIYVIYQPSITNDVSNYTISLTCKDKMCLLNGELGGNLPTSVTFHEYDQVIGNIDVFYNEPGTPPEIGDLMPDPNEYNVYTYNYAYGNQSWTKKYTWNRKYGWKEWDSSSSFKPGGVVSIKNPIYDIVQTVVANFGNEALSKIIINDLPREIKQILRYTGTAPLYYNTTTKIYTFDEDYIKTSESSDTWKVFEYNDDVGYTYTDFVLTGTLITNIGDNVCTVLDKIVSVLGNYEYFYDIDGNFIFQEKRNYLNNSYNPIKEVYNAKSYYLDNNKDGINGEEYIQMSDSNLKVIGKENYKIDLYGDQKSVYTFNQGNGLITSYSNAPVFTNIKNDYHIWGKNANNNNVIHYHVAIKDIPKKTEWDPIEQEYTYKAREVIFVKDEDGRYTGRIRLKNKDDYIQQSATASSRTVTLIDKIAEDGNHIFTYGNDIDSNAKVISINKVSDAEYTKGIIISNLNDAAITDYDKKQLGISVGLDLKEYTPSDWRAELYIQGLEAIKQGKRPDIYQQELLDLFDNIYEFGYYDANDKWVYEGRFKTDMVYRPNNLTYWLDFLEPIDNFYGISVDDIEPKLYSHQQDEIVKIYTDEIPNCVILDESMDDEYQEEVREKCDNEGQPRSVVDEEVYKTLVENTKGYSAQEVARNLLYQYTTYNETINLQSIPIYYLDVNTRITVEDKQSGIEGDYIINSINIPLSPTSAMSITASRALNRI